MTRWLVIVSSGVEANTYGPYTSDDQRLLEARKIVHRKRQITDGLFDPATDSIFWLDYFDPDLHWPQGRPMVGSFLNVELDGVRAAYEDGECPDCRESIPESAAEGNECANCHHVFWGDHHPYHDVGGEG